MANSTFKFSSHTVTAAEKFGQNEFRDVSASVFPVFPNDSYQIVGSWTAKITMYWYLLEHRGSCSLNGRVLVECT